MTDKEILQKVFNIAYSNGWKHSYSITWESGYFTPITQDKQYYKIIFSHDFAKALWGSGDVDDRGRTTDEAWEEVKDSELFLDQADYEYSGEWQIAYCYHLKQMVMCSNPIKYLEKFL